MGLDEHQCEERRKSHSGMDFAGRAAAAVLTSRLVVVVNNSFDRKTSTAAASTCTSSAWAHALYFRWSRAQNPRCTQQQNNRDGRIEHRQADRKQLERVKADDPVP